MPLERTARGHRFDFESRACVVCGTTHQDFLNKGRPACMGHPQEKPEQSKIRTFRLHKHTLHLTLRITNGPGCLCRTQDEGDGA